MCGAGNGKRAGVGGRERATARKISGLHPGAEGSTITALPGLDRVSAVCRLPVVWGGFGEIDVEELLGLLLLRWGTAAAGLIVACCAYARASRRVDIPNQLQSEVTKLKADLKSLTTSVEQTLGAFEDRVTSYQKRIAAYASADVRAPRPAGGNGDGEPVDVQPAIAPGTDLTALSRTNPRATREAIRTARLGG